MALVLLMAMYLNYMCLLIKTKIGTAVENESCLKGKQGRTGIGRNDTMTALGWKCGWQVNFKPTWL